MKKILSLLLSLLLTAALVGCGATKSELPESNTNTLTIRLGGLKGPTTMGMVKLLDDNENGLSVNHYDFTMAASADELTPKLLKGDLDILAVPANLGAVLYNKSNGAVKMLAVNMLGALYIVEKGEETVHSLADLKSKTIFATGKGSTPEYVLAYLLKQSGLDPEKDITIEWKSEPTETVAAMANADHAIAMIPQPYLTVAQMQIDGLRVALDFCREWEQLAESGQFITACLLVRTEFAKEHPEELKLFINEYNNSTSFVKENAEDAAILIEKYGIVKAAVAEKALPQCNIVCLSKKEMKTAAQGYLKVLYEQNPASVGGTLPDDDFYLMYE